MAVTKTLPKGWQLRHKQQYRDSFIEREYTRIAYSDGDRTIYINDIQEPNSFEGWRFLVRVQGSDNRQLGIAENLSEAEKIAREYMMQ